jgi:peptidoglycan/xylan/chitin deacetylase (PgdA/CDA1 family)
MSTTTGVRAVTGPPGSRLGRLLGTGLMPVTPPGGGSLERIVADTESEAGAARLMREGGSPGWEEPVVVEDLDELLRLCRERGRSSIEIWRTDPSLLSSLRLGGWCDAPWRTRLLRRSPLAGSVLRLFALLSSRLLTAVADLAFWAGAREEAGADEWRRLTSSYSVLVYHRLAGELKPGQERIDLAPRRFFRHLRALRMAGFRALPLEDVLAFHLGGLNGLPRRRFVLTVDDAIADSVAPLKHAARHSPQLFVPTAEVGRRAHWIDGEEVAGWEDVRGLAAAGVAIGSHTRHHLRLTELDAPALEEELAGSLSELREKVPEAAEVLAYPNGDHDGRVCAAARAAGYVAAYTTEKGRNGAGTDPFRLRRVSVHAADGALAVLWKTITSEALPGFWLRLRAARKSQPG